MDLPRGRIDTGIGARERVVALPAAWFGELLERFADGHDKLADGLVAPIVDEASAALDEVRDARPEDLAWALSLALARRGLGLVAFERWGDALMLVWRQAPASGRGFTAFATALGARAVSELLGLPAKGVALKADDGSLRVLLASADTCERVSALSAEGLSAQAILDSLTPGDPA